MKKITFILLGAIPLISMAQLSMADLLNDMEPPQKILTITLPIVTCGFGAHYDSLGHVTYAPCCSQIKKDTLPHAVHISAAGQKSKQRQEQPLYIVNGIPVEMGGYANVFYRISPNEVDSVKVLNSAEGIRIYGPRGANGVIIIKLRVGIKRDTITGPVVDNSAKYPKVYSGSLNSPCPVAKTLNKDEKEKTKMSAKEDCITEPTSRDNVTVIENPVLNGGSPLVAWECRVPRLVKGSHSWCYYKWKWLTRSASYFQ
jgi:hypothetical protein